MKILLWKICSCAVTREAEVDSHLEAPFTFFSLFYVHVPASVCMLPLSVTQCFPCVHRKGNCHFVLMGPDRSPIC